jgi:hypothetical protein
MTRLLLTILTLGGVAGAIPYLMLRKTGGIGRSVLAYALGLLVSSFASLGVLLTTHAVLPAPIIDADRVIGSGLLCALIGPILGVLTAKRFRVRNGGAGIT